MDEKKDAPKTIDIMKSSSKFEHFKKGQMNAKNCKAKTGMKKVGRSRNQKGHKNY